MTYDLISTFIKNTDPRVYILFTFKCSKESTDNVILNEIKFFRNERDLMEHVKSNRYVLFNNPIDIQQGNIKKSLDLIKRYLSGKEINLYDEFRQLNVEFLLEQKFSSPFSFKVIQSLLATKHGELTSYSKLGEAIGSKAYRAIGTILKNNPLPIIIPCHRVIKKNGEIGGFMGTMNPGWEIRLKQHLINIESTLIR